MGCAARSDGEPGRAWPMGWSSWMVPPSSWRLIPNTTPASGSAGRWPSWAMPGVPSSGPLRARRGWRRCAWPRRAIPRSRWRTPMYDLYRKLERLEQAGLIAKVLLYPERGARSPRYYHLRAAGARALGLARVGSDQYRRPSPTVYHVGQLRRELALVAERQQWRLLTEETEARRFLASVLVRAAQATYGEQFPAHTLLPTTLKIHPDLLLDTG